MQERGRVVALFGARQVGKSTLAHIVHEESETATTLIQHGTPEAVYEQVRTARKAGAEVILLDGCPGSPDEVQWLYDERLIAPAWGGQLIRIDRNAVVDLVFMRGLAAIETRIQALSMPYFTVRNDDLERGVIDLLRRAGITR